MSGRGGEEGERGDDVNASHLHERARVVSMSYYYTCATRRDTQRVDCIRSETGFKDFENPLDYTRRIRIVLAREVADRTFADARIGMRLVATETGESRILRAEVGSYTLLTTH